ncbi:hypothetical protein MOVS_01365 [Moraxella ovis]|uniref:Minor tail T domain-containing protein n=1 Tax=Moraxella ovis TaxID=29433 RepID=A0A378PIR0_9GAMM|nr:DUF4035 domain-containing protein [Moraxella ovis]ANB90865.1 hypothetical protein MOVS_01365 [Moraxella ovis]STY86307.1 Uncharacterised protein [Moraxella ovis]
MFKLALALGRTVGELEHSLSYEELICWQAYDRLDPFGGFRQDIQTAHLLYAKAGSSDCTVADFLPIDPNPMTDEMREEYEQFKKEQELQRHSEALMRMFDRLEKA